MKIIVKAMVVGVILLMALFYLDHGHRHLRRLWQRHWRTSAALLKEKRFIRLVLETVATVCVSLMIMSPVIYALYDAAVHATALILEA